MLPIVKVINATFVLGVVWAIFGDASPNWLTYIIGAYTVFMVVIGVVILNAERITAWCDRQLEGKDKD